MIPQQTVSVLNTSNGNTTGTVNASTVTTAAGANTDVITSYNLGTITNLKMKNSY